MKKLFSKLFIVLITLSMTLSVISAMPMKVSAATTPTIAATASGTCGTGVYWEYFEDTQTLYIHGSGAITSSPWNSYASSIKKIVVGNQITSICEGAFRECQAITEITLPFVGEHQAEIGPNTTLGFIFGYDTVYFSRSEFYYHTVVTTTLSCTGYTGYSCDRTQLNGTCDVMYYGSSEREYIDSYLGVPSGRAVGSNANTGIDVSKNYVDEAFINYQVNASYELSASSKVVRPKNSTWQYSAYTHEGHIIVISSNSAYPSSGEDFSLEAYYYYIPSTLQVVNITNTNKLSVAAFNGCSNIKTINFYSNITSIGDYAFQNCPANVNYLYDDNLETYTYTNGLDTFTYFVQNGTATIMGCETTNEAVTVPSYMGEYLVTTIAYNAFANNTQIKSIILPTTIAKVDGYAFYNCTNLENVTLGTSLVEIGDYAFYNTALSRVTTPSSLRTIGNYAFANCSALTKFTMRSGLERLGDGVFYNATQLSDVTLSNTIDAISDFCFYNCNALIEINIPASVIKIGNCAFEKCTNLTAATIEGNAEYIGKKAFYSCNLSSFDFGNNLTYLGADSFSLNPITTADLPNTVTQIGAQAFSDCQLLSNLYVPDSVTIGSNALYNNASNLKVTIRYNTGSISDKMLYKNKMSIVVMEDGITDIGEYAFAECTDLTGITFPETLKNIGNYAFYKSKLSANITLPQKVTTIGNYAFSGATALSEISMPDSIQIIGTKAFDATVSVNIYQHLGKIQADLFNGQLVKAIFIEGEVDSVGDGAFANCGNLVEVSLPDTISHMGNGCFTSSNNVVLTVRTVDGKIDNEVFRGKLGNITTVKIDDSNIGAYAFADNAKLESFSIEHSHPAEDTKSIGEGAFENCVALNEMVFPATVNSIGSHAFYGCASLVSVNIPNGVTQIKPYTFYNCSSLTSMILPQTVSSIGEYAFYGCADMASINIPNGVETIPDYAFYGCGSLETIDIADTVINIGNYSFYGCIVVSSADISTQCVSVGDYAFYNCKTLASLELPDSLKNIGDYAFASCIKLTNVTLGEAVESLGESAFYNCTGLLSISFGKCITALPSQAIGGCYNLESVYIYAPLSHIDDYAFYGAEGTTAYIGYDVYMINFFEENGIDYVIMDDYVYEYKITFVTDNGEIICSDFYASGATVTRPANPTKDSDNTYTYVFASWDQEITVVDGHKTYIAIFTPVYIEYTIVFKNHNGDILSSETYHYGDTVTTPSNPTRAADNTYTYAFAGWDNEIVACAGNATYTATYTPTYIDYTVVFKDYDGEIISTDTYHYGDAVTAPSNPVKEADLVGTYSFKSWDNAVVNCVGDVTYTAIYDMSYIDYIVVFKDYDGDVISTNTYHYGDTIIAPTNPTREADNTYTYAFAGWDKSVVSCAGDATYTATYTPTYIEYTVVFKDYDGETISSKDYHYGDTITVPSDPTRAADNAYTYAFAGWDTSVALTCGGSDTYTATYTPTYIEYTVVFKDYDGEIISTNNYHYGNEVTAPADPTRGSDVVASYTFKSWDKAVVACAGDATYTATYDVSYTDYTVVFKNYNGDVLSTNTYHYGDTVVVPSAPSKPADETYIYAFIGWDKTVTTCEGNATYTAKFASTNVEYTVVFKNADGTVLSTKTYHYGDEVVIPNTPTKAADNTYTYTFAGWDKEVVDCVADATYTATYTPVYINYTITFTDYDGRTITTVTYHYGDTIESIANPTRASDETYTYTFNGWNKELGTCKGDATFKATYTSTYIDYTVIFKNEDGTVLSRNTYHYGDAVAIPATPTRVADNTYTYTFKGWDQAVVNCAGDTTYTATYNANYIDYTVIFKNEDGTVLSTKTYHYGDEVTAPETPTKAADNTYTYTFKAWDKTVVDCAGDAIYTATYNSAHIDYTVIFKDEDGTVLSTKTYHYGDEVTAPEAPTKAADNTYTYTFKGWDKAVVNCAGNATYTATYNATYIDYTVTFKNEDGSILSSDTYHYGESVVAPSTPSKAANNTYTYTFAGWDSEVVACNGNKTYTATYTPVYIEYTVVFKNWNGDVISSNVYTYGQTVTKPSDPTRAADTTYTYAFMGWDKTVTNCTESVVYTATYSSTYIDYEIVFKNYDGSILSSETYHYGDAVVVTETPTKPADESYAYGFAGWDSEVTACLGNKTYTATFNPTNVEYTVVFKDHNGNVISSETYHFGDEVVVPEAPSRNADNTYTYTFKNWGKTVAETCVGDAEYTANYEATYIEYNIKFLDWDGSLIQTVKYHYGDTITAIADPERASDETYTYTFLSWNKALGTCTGNASFTAQYESTFINYTVVFKDYDGSVISRKTYHFGDTITIPADPERASDETYIYTFKDWGNISTSCNGNKEYTAVYNSEYIEYTVVFKDHNGDTLSSKTYHYGDEVVIPSDPTRVADNTYTYTFAGWDKEIVACEGDATFKATYTSTYIDYTVIFKNEDGKILSHNTYHYGEKVNVPEAPTKAADNTYTYTFKAWDKTVVDCAGDATYTATYDSTYIDYTVIFKNEDGTVLSTNTYHYGDEITTPETPTKAADNTYTYTFKAWDKTVVDCAGDATYTATYDSTYIDYIVIFKNEDGTVLSTETYHYGDEVSVPTNPTKESDNDYTYTFNGWDKETVACDGDATYTATYTATEIEDTSTPGTDTEPDTNPDTNVNTPSENDTNDENDGLSGGAIAGTVVGSAVVTGAGGFAIWWFAIQKHTVTEFGTACKNIIKKIKNLFSKRK